MASIRRRGAAWRAEIVRGDHRESRTFDTRVEAEDWAKAREADLLSSESMRARQTFAQAAGRWKSTKTLTRSEETRVRALCGNAWASKSLADVTSDELSAWRDDRLKATKKDGAPIAPATVAREMATLRAVLTYARKDLKWIAASPLHDVSTPEEPPARRRGLSDAERDAMLVALGYSGEVTTVRHEVAVALLLALETAMRAGELIGMEWSRVTGNVAHLPKTKNGDARDVPLSRRAVELLESMRGRTLKHVRAQGRADDGRVFHIDSDSLDTLFRRAREAAGLKGFTFHDSRSAALTRLAKVLTPLELARMVGHRDLNSLLSYYAEPATSIAAKLD